mgnify:CR=1 FL=1
MARAKDPITGLTPQQDHFAHLIALNGLSQSEAYNQAYDAANSLPSTVTENASRLAADSNVAARIQQLKASLQAETLASAASIIRELLTVGNVKVPADQVRASDKVAALDKVAKILGLYKEADTQLQRPAAITQVTVVLHQAGVAPRVVEMPVSAPKEALEGVEVVNGTAESLEAPQIEA